MKKLIFIASLLNYSFIYSTPEAAESIEQKINASRQCKNFVEKNPEAYKNLMAIIYNSDKKPKKAQKKAIKEALQGFEGAEETRVLSTIMGAIPQTGWTDDGNVLRRIIKSVLNFKFSNV